MKKIWNWLVLSSVDPSKTALTVKGALTAVVPLLVLFSGAFNIETDSSTIKNVIDVVGTIVMQGLTLVGTGMSLYGLIRKIDLTSREG